MHNLRNGRGLQYAKSARLTSCSAKYIFTGNYWTAVIYFKARNGTYHRVPQRAQQGIEKTNGGMVQPSPYSFPFPLTNPPIL
jgi:hypothetical protein